MDFPRKCLRVPRRGSRRRDLSKVLNKQIIDEEDEPAPPVGFARNRKGSSDLQIVARRVSRKLEEGNIKGAVRSYISYIYIIILYNTINIIYTI